MTTQAQIEANRRNARYSTGPRTPKGKTASARNALKHGLLAGRFAVTEHTAAAFERFRDELLRELNPVGLTETLLADRIAYLAWRLSRSDLAQTGALGVLAENTIKSIKQFESPSELPPLASARDQEEYLLGRTFVRDFSNRNILDRFAVYQRRIERSLQHARQELHRLQTRRADSVNPPAGEPSSPPHLTSILYPPTPDS